MKSKLFYVYFSFIVFFKLPHNVLQLQEVGDFGALNCLPALNLIRSTKLHVTGKSGQCDHPNPVEADHPNPEQTDQANPEQIDHPLSYQ